MADATQTTAAPEAQTGLTVQDLTLVLQVIQVASSRGAFKADELTAVGGLYDRIFKFLEASGAITTKPVEVTPAVDTTEPTATVTETAAA
jgi:hypothetical protein